jgi:hypothetical protein
VLLTDLNDKFAVCTRVLIYQSCVPVGICHVQARHHPSLSDYATSARTSTFMSCFTVKSHLHHAIRALLLCLLTGDSIIHPKMQNREVDCNIDKTVFHLPSEFQCAKRQTPNVCQRHALLMPGTEING